MVELGPRGTGQVAPVPQVSPYAHLVSGGKATLPRCSSTTRRGAGSSRSIRRCLLRRRQRHRLRSKKDGVNIFKGYMESGEFSRRQGVHRASGAVVMVGTFEVDVAHQQRSATSFGHSRSRSATNTAFMDRNPCLHSWMGRPEIAAWALYSALWTGQRLPVRGLEPAA